MCQFCCYPTEELSDSIGYRHWMNSIYKSYIYNNRGVEYELGPLCWPYEAPKVEDSYHNVAPDVSLSTLLPGDVPMELFYHPPSLIHFGMEKDIEYFGFKLLSSPPLGFSYKFTGLGQVSLRSNMSWYFS
ncbi:hypothetical protein KIN20_009228 [Parelaphostrongylus tenuis]|uniref:Uncharacterized protein n=1 Tax=Parelaphostrongylus tenuis TaxID=148309 RepID=A0AAD5MNV2_PARTN|nr:hypothetical protein KIN20_009228 [Parelaphostrongylus tenuis]